MGCRGSLGLAEFGDAADWLVVSPGIIEIFIMSMDGTFIRWFYYFQKKGLFSLGFGLRVEMCYWCVWWCMWACFIDAGLVVRWDSTWALSWRTTTLRIDGIMLILEIMCPHFMQGIIYSKELNKSFLCSTRDHLELWRLDGRFSKSNRQNWMRQIKIQIHWWNSLATCTDPVQPFLWSNPRCGWVGLLNQGTAIMDYALI